MTDRAPWLVFTESISARVLVDSGVIDALRERVGGRLVLVEATRSGVLGPWRDRLPDEVVELDAVAPLQASFRERVARRVDRELDARFGFYPAAIRLNHREGFHRERMARGHRNWFLDSDRIGPLPRRPRIDAAIERWTFSSRRHVPPPLLDRMRTDARGVVFANLQHETAVPFLAAGRRLQLPLVANVASWDHTVGKGVIPPFLDRYVVQNAAMAADLVRHHRVPVERIEVAGWPQTDVFARPRPREDFDALAVSLGLDPGLPLVVYMGNTPTNMPWEGSFVDLLLDRFDATGARRRYGLLVRPHPRDRDWAERFGRAWEVEGAALMEPGYADLDRLALLLRHCACVVSNAGTVLLDAIVNDRPTVCMLSDEGAPTGEHWAEKSVVGDHYRELMASGAFTQARSVDAVLDAIDDALHDPGRLAEERRAVVATVVGPVDGHAAQRTADALARGLAR
jgi:hypothetical protein